MVSQQGCNEIVITHEEREQLNDSDEIAEVGDGGENCLQGGESSHL